MAWNGSGCANEPVKRNDGESCCQKPSLFKRGKLAGFIVIVGAGLAVFLILDRAGDPAAVKGKPDKALRIADVKPARLPSVETGMVAEVKNVVPAMTGRVIRARQTQQMRTLPDGTKVPVVSKSPFTNGIERAFSTLCNPGGMAIPLSMALRRFSRDEIMRIINTPMEYDKDDSEELLARKMQMQQLKDEIRDYLHEGGTLEAALAEIDKTCRRDSAYLMMMRRSMNEALATKDGEVIRAFVKKTNEKLKERGMRPFEVPPRYRLLDEKTDKTNEEKINE